MRGFSRDNIGLAVHGYFIDESHKLEVLQENVTEAVRVQGHGIVYGATHHRVETLAANLVGPRCAGGRLPRRPSRPGAQPDSSNGSTMTSSM